MRQLLLSFAFRISHFGIRSTEYGVRNTSCTWQRASECAYSHNACALLPARRIRGPYGIPSSPKSSTPPQGATLPAKPAQQLFLPPHHAVPEPHGLSRGMPGLAACPGVFPGWRRAPSASWSASNCQTRTLIGAVFVGAVVTRTSSVNALARGGLIRPFSQNILSGSPRVRSSGCV